MAIFILGEFGFLLTTIAWVFLILIFFPNCFPTSFILLVNSESSFSFPANNAVSSAYLKLFYLLHPTLIPFILIICLKILSVYKLKRVGDATHPCLTPRCIFISSDNSFVIRCLIPVQVSDDLYVISVYSNLT